MKKLTTIIFILLLSVNLISCQNSQFTNTELGIQFDWKDKILFNGNNTEISLTKTAINTYNFILKRVLITSEEQIGKGVIKINESLTKKGTGSMEAIFSEFSSFGPETVIYSYNVGGNTSLSTTIISSSYESLPNGETDVFYQK